MPAGIYIRTAEHNQKISEALKGRPVPEEARRKISKKLTGVPFTEERRLKSIEFYKTHIVTEETREKLSASSKGRHHTEESKRKSSESKKGKPQSEEHIRKLIEIRNDPEYRHNISEKAKARYAAMTPKERFESCKKWNAAGLKAAEGILVSSLEHKMWEVLDGLGVVYETQKLFGCWYADIYVPDKNLIIECNGDYWHNLPHRKERDRRLQKHCDSKGIKIVWLWEGEIEENPKEALLKQFKI